MNPDIKNNNTINIDDKGCTYISGTTTSTDFSTSENALSKTYNGGSGERCQGDAFFLKLSADGSTLEYSTYIGGSGDDMINTILIDNHDAVYISGLAKSTDFPTTGDALNKTIQGGADCFFMKFSWDLNQLLYSTLIGGSKDESANIQIHQSGLLFISGET